MRLCAAACIGGIILVFKGLAWQLCFHSQSPVLQLRTELDDAGLCPERVELLWELYKKARAAQEQQREAPAGALAEAGDLNEPVAPAASQVCTHPMAAASIQV